MGRLPPARRRMRVHGALGAIALVLACAAGRPVMAQPADAQPTRWSTLGADRQNLLAPFADQWDGWADGERRAWLALADRFPAMPPAEQLRARERIRQWAELDPEQRQVARANFGLTRRMPEHQRVEQWQRYRAMTPEQRSVLREHGSTSNTAARFAGSPTGLAKEAARPLGDVPPAVPTAAPAAASPGPGTPASGAR